MTAILQNASGKILVNNGRVLRSEPFITPIDKPNLFLWTPAWKQVYANAVLVPSFADFSGNNRHDVQATSGSQPAFKTNALGSKPAVVWSAGKFMTTDVTAIKNRAGVTHFIVFKRTANATAMTLYNYSVSSGSSGRFAASINSGGNPDMGITIRRQDSEPTPAASFAHQDTNWHFLVVRVDYANNLYTVRLDGVQRLQQAVSTPGSTDNTNSSQATIGATSNAGNNVLSGEIADRFLYTSALSDADIIELENFYIKSFYGL